MPRVQDLIGVMKGVQFVAQAGLQLQEQTLRIIWANSTARSALNSALDNLANQKPPKPEDIAKAASDTVERITTIAQGIKDYIELSAKPIVKPTHQPFKSKDEIVEKKTSVYEKEQVLEEYEIKLTPQEKAILHKIDMEHAQKLKKQEERIQSMASKKDNDPGQQKSDEIPEPASSNDKNEATPQAIPHSSAKEKLKLNPNAKQRTVPASRISRMVSFGSLAAGLGIGTAAEYARRSLGLGKNVPQNENMFLNEANVERIVDTLCKVRGAALKIGQLLSIQDESIVSPQLAKTFERVRQSADFMPTWQVEKVLVSQLGSDWRDKFAEFEMKPFAAASIGQVHLARTKDGKEVAMKIQYPGVAKGINSDIDNLVGIMKVWNIFPEGMFIDNFVAVAKRELAWEVDYAREAECTKVFKKLLEPYPDYYVPDVIDEFCTSEIITTELIDGTPIDECFDLDQETKEDIARKIMTLSIKEVVEFQYMQSDPNWANFFYNKNTKQLILLDFGASQSYPKPFMDIYVKIIKAACDGDRDAVLKLSKDLGFFTGYESKIMEDAHVDATMYLGEIYRSDLFDFANQKTTRKIQELVPTMLAHRLRPPPEEIYSLHRKLSGVFLLCSKLKVAINCRKIFLDHYEKYKFD